MERRGDERTAEVVNDGGTHLGIGIAQKHFLERIRSAVVVALFVRQAVAEELAVDGGRGRRFPRHVNGRRAGIVGRRHNGLAIRHWRKQTKTQ